LELNCKVVSIIVVAVAIGLVLKSPVVVAKVQDEKHHGLGCLALNIMRLHDLLKDSLTLFNVPLLC
jgi:hypothetical protein